MELITVYTKPACVQCNAVVKALEKLKLNFRKVDITADPAARDYPDRIKALAATHRAA
jgi:glutaredoxin-like protein NrdH